MVSVSVGEMSRQLIHPIRGDRSNFSFNSLLVTRGLINRACLKATPPALLAPSQNQTTCQCCIAQVVSQGWRKPYWKPDVTMSRCAASFGVAETGTVT